MNKEFIPYEQALALKELGFDEENCFGRWTTYPDGEGYLDTTAKSAFQGQDSMNRQCLAPLYQQAFRWFREKHGLISYIHPLALLENDGLWCYEITNFSNNWDESFDLHSPEEAELECLKKLIEIVKEKK